MPQARGANPIATDLNNPENLAFSLHVPVMLDEIRALAASVPQLRLSIDCTLGAGGHAEALLAAYPELRCVGIDADPEACARSSARFAVYRDRLAVVNSYYDEALEALSSLEAAAPAEILGERAPSFLDANGKLSASFILFDLGISTYQLAASGRGFSFASDEPLDMRFSPQASLSAADIVAKYPEQQLADLIYTYGEERYSRRIARAIVAARRTERIHRAARLAEIIAESVPSEYRHGRLHPATRTFQALRIAVNDELGRAERAIRSAIGLLERDGICAVISFHSLEDRIVKHIFAETARGEEFSLEWKKPKEPTEEEIRRNPPSRSAKLRAIRARAKPVRQGGRRREDEHNGQEGEVEA